MKAFAKFLPRTVLVSLFAFGGTVIAVQAQPVDDSVIAAQRAALAAAASGRSFGPQAPRDIDNTAGSNPINFTDAPDRAQMNLCTIYFTKGAEHRGGAFTTYAGNGDGRGNGTGYLYDGTLSAEETAPTGFSIGFGDANATLKPGDTIEAHYVHTTTDVTPGPGIERCFGGSNEAPRLRIEAQVYVVVNDANADDFEKLTEVRLVNDKHQAVNIPFFTGTPVVYDGSLSGPRFNQLPSPRRVTWSVRPEVMKISARSIANWLADNPFDERGARGVRNLVTNEALLSPIE
ncbi:MAG: delta-class carbonic anhydrase [Litoreibacter sp.]|nr:delta-class carbonic anhydrase [Litoreibacter sp.]